MGIELLKSEAKKASGGIGTASTLKSSSKATTVSTTTTGLSQQQLKAIKLRKRESSAISVSTSTETNSVVSSNISSGAANRCSTTDEELDALFAAIDQEIELDPEAALDLMEVLEDDPDKIAEAEQEVYSSSIYIPDDDYEMQMDEVQEEEDEEMKEMLALIENAKYDLKDRDEGELMEMVEKIDDDDYYNKLKMDIKDKQQEKKRQEDLSISAAQIKTNEEDEARRKAEEEARRKAQVEAKKKIEDDAKIKSSNEVKIKDTKKELDTENKKKLELNASRKSEADSRKMALELMKRKANQAKEELEKSTVPTEPRKHILEGVTNKIVDTKRKMEEEAQ